MSQQSTLKMMLPFYKKWMHRFPDLSSLAKAQEEEVLQLWQGLGYYSRARNVLKAAQKLVDYQNFPSNVEELLLIKGIGPYTASAIASIAFDQAVIPVDGNVIRVLSRLFLIPNALNDRSDLKKIQEKALELAQYVPAGQRGAMAQALMDLGATVCRPGALAQCVGCPLRKLCETYKVEISSGRLKVAAIPQKKERQGLQKITRLLLLYRNKAGCLLIRKRPSGLPLEGQWELPSIDLVSSDDWVRERLGGAFEVKRGFRHTIMNSAYSVWLVEAGQFSGVLRGHLFYSKDPQTPLMLTTMTQKALFVLEKNL